MKIFFNASLNGKAEYQEHYEAIKSAIIQTGHHLLAAPVFETDPVTVTQASSEEARAYFDKLISWFKQADIIVFEVSYPSTSIGFEVAMAMQHAKPVIALHVDSAPENALLSSFSTTDEKLQLLDYNLDDVSNVVSSSIEYAAGTQDTRFNFFISPKIVDHLDRVTKLQRVSRAVYLRRLIEDDMKENVEFNS